MLGDEYDEFDEQNVSFIVLKRGVDSWSWKDKVEEEDDDDDDDEDEDGHDFNCEHFLFEVFLLSVFEGFLGALGGRVNVLLCFLFTSLFARVLFVWDFAAVVAAISEVFFGKFIKTFRIQI